MVVPDLPSVARSQLEAHQDASPQRITHPLFLQIIPPALLVARCIYVQLLAGLRAPWLCKLNLPSLAARQPLHALYHPVSPLQRRRLSSFQPQLQLHVMFR